MRVLMLTVALLLTGCVSGSVTVQNDVTGKQVSCRAEYTSLFKNIESIDLNACGAGAGATRSLAQLKLEDALQRALEYAKAAQ